VQAGVDHVATDAIGQEQWIKYTFLTTLAAATCLMRADVGTIVATDDGAAIVRGLYDECVAVAEAAGEPIPGKAREIALAATTQSGSALKASMLRDLEAGQQVEAEHIVGDMLVRARAADQAAPLLAVAYAHLQAYQQQRKG
jgi:2-dehydropantoate 2-reductase